MLNLTRIFYNFGGLAANSNSYVVLRSQYPDDRVAGFVPKMCLPAIEIG
jgi:hypothetical protein